MNGILLIGLLIVAGMGITGAYFHWRMPEIAARIKSDREALPEDVEGRIDRWLEFVAPGIHQVLVQLRFSAQRPWLVTHVVVPGEGEPEIHGVDLSGVGPQVARREGMCVVVDLPAVELLGRGELSGDKARNVPRFAGGGQAGFDPRQRAAALVRWGLKKIPEALERDIEGASLEIHVGGEPVPPPREEP